MTLVVQECSDFLINKHIHSFQAPINGEIQRDSQHGKPVPIQHPFFDYAFPILQPESFAEFPFLSLALLTLSPLLIFLSLALSRLPHLGFVSRLQLGELPGFLVIGRYGTGGGGHGGLL